MQSEPRLRRPEAPRARQRAAHEHARPRAYIFPRDARRVLLGIYANPFEIRSLTARKRAYLEEQQRVRNVAGAFALWRKLGPHHPRTELRAAGRDLQLNEILEA